MTRPFHRAQKRTGGSEGVHAKLGACQATRKDVEVGLVVVDDEHGAST